MRVLAVAGLPTPAMQIIRSISEDVRHGAGRCSCGPKVARQFAECRTPQEAGEFWKRHIAGGRAFRAVAEQLYRVGLDYSKTAATPAGARRSRCCWARPSNLLCRRRRAGRRLGWQLPLLRDAAAAGAVRLLPDAGPGAARRPRRRGDRGGPAEQALIRVTLEGGEIVLDQMRWLTAAEEPGAWSAGQLTRAAALIGGAAAAPSLFSAIQRAARTSAPIEKSLPWAATISAAISAMRRKKQVLALFLGRQLRRHARLLRPIN